MGGTFPVLSRFVVLHRLRRSSFPLALTVRREQEGTSRHEIRLPHCLIANAAPGLFTSDGSGNGFAAGYVLRVKVNGAQLVEQIARWDSALSKMVGVPIDLSIATDQVYLVAFGTGFRYRSSLTGVSSTIGGTASSVLFAGEQGGFVGVDQINLLLPKSLAGRGDVNLALTVDGQTSNSVKLQFR
ncbi:MAG: hypothetical protein AAB401_02035, partial [Acidobacteriota bacterium]